MSAYNKIFSKVSKPQSSAETRVSHSLITYYFFPCLLCESRVRAWIQVVFAGSVSQVVPYPQSPVYRRVPLLLQVFPGPWVIPYILLWSCAFDNYAVRMSTEAYSIFGVILTRMGESGALLAPKWVDNKSWGFVRPGWQPAVLTGTSSPLKQFCHLCKFVLFMLQLTF